MVALPHDIATFKHPPIGKPTYGNPGPVHGQLHFEPADESAADPDNAVLSEQDLQMASERGKLNHKGAINGKHTQPG